MSISRQPCRICLTAWRSSASRCILRRIIIIRQMPETSDSEPCSSLAKHTGAQMAAEAGTNTVSQDWVANFFYWTGWRRMPNMVSLARNVLYQELENSCAPATVTQGAPNNLRPWQLHIQLPCSIESTGCWSMFQRLLQFQCSRNLSYHHHNGRTHLFRQFRKKMMTKRKNRLRPPRNAREGKDGSPQKTKTSRPASNDPPPLPISSCQSASGRLG